MIADHPQPGGGWRGTNLVGGGPGKHRKLLAPGAACHVTLEEFMAQSAQAHLEVGAAQVGCCGEFESASRIAEDCQGCGAGL